MFALCISFSSRRTKANDMAAPTNSSPRESSAIAGQDKSLGKRINPILAALKIEDADKAAKVRETLANFFVAQKSWHETNDAALKKLWNDFNKARSEKNEKKADAALSKIENVYALFKTQHDKLLSGLASVLTPEQIETVEDVMTVNKVRVTYRVYLEIFPQLTDAQKAVVLKNLKAAREEAIDAGSMAEKSAFFKKYKIKIEDDYLTAQGYDPKKARQDFEAKQKAESAVTNSAGKAKSKE